MVKDNVFLTGKLVGLFQQEDAATQITSLPKAFPVLEVPYPSKTPPLGRHSSGGRVETRRRVIRPGWVGWEGSELPLGETEISWAQDLSG